MVTIPAEDGRRWMPLGSAADVVCVRALAGGTWWDKRRFTVRRSRAKQAAAAFLGRHYYELRRSRSRAVSRFSRL